jgi:ankyrin repeat protein
LKSRTIQALLLGTTLVTTAFRVATAQPGTPSETEKERKEQFLNAELFHALPNHNAGEIQSLLAQGAGPNVRNWLGFTGLMWSALVGDTGTTNALLAQKADIEAPSIFGTALSFALVGRNSANASLLLDRGASVRTGRADAATPLMLASGNGDLSLVKRLLTKKDNPNAQDADGATPLIYAARNGQANVVEVLIQAGAGLNTMDSHGMTALMYAAKNGQAATVNALLTHKAQVNLSDKKGASALIFAAHYNGSEAVINSLLRAGANVNLKDSQGTTALALAETREYNEAVQALKKAGATSPHATLVSLKATTRPAVERSLSALQTGMKTFASRVQCGSCHHQGLGMMALGTAQQHGFAVDKELVGSYLKQAGEDGKRMGPAIHQALSDPNAGKVIPGMDIRDFSIAAGYMFSALVAQGVPTNPGLQEAAQFMAAQQSPDGHWGYAMERGPMQSSYLTVTALNLQVLHAYGSPEKSGHMANTITRARQWLLTVPTPNTEDKSSRLLGLKWADATKEERTKVLQELLQAQRKDGGWSQQPSLASDAYATGMALYALHVGGELSTEDPAYQRGVRFLLRTQDEDGSWYVNKAANPANIYMDAGFPHGESQYISFAATCWATMALLQGNEATQSAGR